MGIATKAGKRLGDIVLAIGKQTLVKARNVFCYMVKLISIDRDWVAYMAPTVKREQDQEARTRAIAKHQNDFNVVKKAIGENGTLEVRDKVIFMEGEAVYVRTSDGHVGRLLDFEKLARKILDGTLKA